MRDMDQWNLMRECSGTAGGLGGMTESSETHGTAGRMGVYDGILRVRGGNRVGRGCQVCSPGGVECEEPG